MVNESRELEGITRREFIKLGGGFVVYVLACSPVHAQDAKPRRSSEIFRYPVSVLRPSFMDKTKPTPIESDDRVLEDITKFNDYDVEVLRTTRYTTMKTAERHPDFSPDGKWMAFECMEGPESEICIAQCYGKDRDLSVAIGVARDGKSRFTEPSWSPDGKYIVFSTDCLGSYQLFVAPVMDAGPVRRLTKIVGNYPHWSSKGTIVFDSYQKLYTIPPGGGKPRKLTGPFAKERLPRWSPDGKKIVYSNIDGDNWEIFVMDADGTNQKKLVSDRNWNVDPVWHPWGWHIAYSSTKDGTWDIHILHLNLIEK